MPDAAATRPRLYTIPPSAPFLSTLARALLNGDLPAPGGTKPDPLALPHAVIYLPTRRAVRALRDALLEASGGRAALLPSIRALGDPDEDAAIIFGAEDDTEAGFAGIGGTRAIGPLERRLALMRLVLTWSKKLHESGIASPGEFGPPPVMTPAQASYLAADLGNLMDFIESEEVDLSALEGLAPEEYAAHWEQTVNFLKIVTQHWPAHLAEHGVISPIARRAALMAFEARRLAEAPPAGPVIAAGSTGTVPATARLLNVIASLPNGAVVLPGLDLSLDDKSWASLSEHPEHPQTGMAQLLIKLGATRDDVRYVQGSQPNVERRARLRFVSEVLRPASDTDHWHAFLKSEDASLPTALAGLQTLETPAAHDEAEAIALVLREAIETPGKTAALITPDRMLARRVAARLKAYDIVIDDSAGVPVARTLPGGFLDLVIVAAASDFAPQELIALLKHPLTLLGREPEKIRGAARTLERIAFRDIYVGQGLAGVADAVKAAGTKEPRRRGCIRDEDRRLALRLVEDLQAAFAPLSALLADISAPTAARLAEAHGAAAEALAKDSGGSSSHLWQGTAGEAMSVLLAELIVEGGRISLAPSDYAPFYRSLLAGRVARPRRLAHPRLFIWGPLEARLQQPDVVILGSLNEGVWPRPQEASPWLSRPMAATLGLPSPERRIGLSAHDFAQALGAPSVYLSRAIKVDGVPTVPSRWLQRLNALVEAAKLKGKIAPEQPWVAWARERDTAPNFTPVDPPRPCPPVEARPRRLSVTRVEKLIANPYEIFARCILGLEALKPLGELPDNAMRGQIVHHALHQFAVDHPNSLPDGIAEELIKSADDWLNSLGGSPRVEAFWRPGFALFAKWFAETEPARRSGVVKVEAEVVGALGLKVERGFRLSVRADRIDLREDGSAVIYDYKTGRVPTVKQVEELFAPQLPLEAAIVAGGGFDAVGAREVSSLHYIKVTGRGDGGEHQQATKAAAPAGLAEKALADLVRLIEHFDRADTAYEAQRRPGTAFARIYDYDNYAHLARLAEWETVGLEEEIW